MCMRKEGEPGIQCHVTNVTPYTRVGRVAGGDNCTCIFKRLQLDVDGGMVPKPLSECSKILQRPVFDELKLADRFEINSC